MTHNIFKTFLFSAWPHSVCHSTRRYRKSLAFFTLALGAVLLAGCGKDNKDNGKPEATQIKQTECGQHFETQAKNLAEGEQYVVEWVDGAARVIHVGMAVTCDYESVTVDVAVDGSTVTVNECPVGGGYVDCLCIIDNMFTIASLPHGTYTFIFKECGYENHRQEYTI